MDQQIKLIAVEPQYAVPGGEIAITCDGFDASRTAKAGVFFGNERCRVVAASSKRVLAVLPPNIANDSAQPREGKTQLRIESDGAASNSIDLTVGRILVDGMHIVANPAVDPSDDSLILTRSGSRGQHLEATLFRLEPDGYLDEMSEPILNPTGIAFDREGQMFVTNRAEGEVCAVGRDGTSSVHASGLGIATGIAFDSEDRMYVGDRSGTVFRVDKSSEVETFTVLDPSVAAYHMAFGPDGRLFVTSPGLASHDAVHVVDKEGFDEHFFRGLGRPQGLAFDKAGFLYVAGCYKGHHGIVRISPDGGSCEHFLAGNNVVGLCFTRKGEMIVATGDSVYSVPCGVQGILLNS